MHVQIYSSLSNRLPIKILKKKKKQDIAHNKAHKTCQIFSKNIGF